MPETEKTHHIGESITLQLTSCLTGLDLTKQENFGSFNISKAAESKQHKQEIRWTVILPLKLGFSAVKPEAIATTYLNLITSTTFCLLTSTVEEANTKSRFFKEIMTVQIIVFDFSIYVPSLLWMPEP